MGLIDDKNFNITPGKSWLGPMLVQTGFLGPCGCPIIRPSERTCTLLPDDAEECTEPIDACEPELAWPFCAFACEEALAWPTLNELLLAFDCPPKTGWFTLNELASDAEIPVNPAANDEDWLADSEDLQYKEKKKKEQKIND